METGKQSIVIPTIWAEDGGNSIMDAYRADNSFQQAAEVSTDRAEPERRPEEQQEPQKPESLSDRHHAIALEEQDAHTAARARKENIEALAEELGVDSEELRVPKSLTGYNASLIAKVMADFDFSVSDLKSPSKIELLKTACEDEARRAEELELEEVRKNLESEEDPEDEDEAEEGEEEAEESEEEEQPETEEKPEEQASIELPKTLREMTPEQRESMDKHLNEVYQAAMKANHPAYVEYSGEALAEVLDIEAEHRPKFQAAAQVLTTMGENMLQTRVPQLVGTFMMEHMPQLLEHFMPGSAALFRQAQIANTWQSVLEQDEFKDLGLPKWNSPEFSQAAEKVHKANPWLVDFDPPGPDGRPLPINEALFAKAAITARLLAGDRTSPKRMMEQAAQAFAKGKQEATRANRRVSAGRSLGAGKTTGKISERAEYLSMMDAYNLHHGNSFGSDK